MCYNEIKLENKINNLTNNKQKQTKKEKIMAEIIKLPNTVVDSDWKDDVDVDYAIYGGTEKNEREYVPQAEIKKETIERIKSQKVGKFALFTAKTEQKAA